MSKPITKGKFRKEIIPGVREYNEGMELELSFDDEHERVVLCAFNEGGYNSVAIDLLDLVDALKSRGFAP